MGQTSGGKRRLAGPFGSPRYLAGIFKVEEKPGEMVGTPGEVEGRRQEGSPRLSRGSCDDILEVMWSPLRVKLLEVFWNFPSQDIEFGYSSLLSDDLRPVSLPVTESHSGGHSPAGLLQPGNPERNHQRRGGGLQEHHPG